MTFKLEQANLNDLDELEQLYNATIDSLNENINYPGWIKGNYPVRETAADGITAGTLYVIRQKNRIAGTIILNHKPEPAYQEARWGIPAKKDEVFIIHTFVVHPSCSGQGIGEKMLKAAIDLAHKQNMKAIRLDVYENNLPAIRLYEKCGFDYITTVDLGLGMYGLDAFKLYEYY
ncbi:GNAT family N-acetyltransferase [Enterococcus sp. BWM-S5]|uniref:GNAT family N-acetyltransferase n=1 Tax=Enterococcus larvae TaxID=2794352 RepID=A0ABS4CHA0_9ENTE|nr:GNAT family N-acetyltransferase [Enterococcus larvae]MBP1045234.1 GNAT family N-acetyltransferase [Enterococcus larvae]